jgi:hypothetical protein
MFQTSWIISSYNQYPFIQIPDKGVHLFLTFTGI